MCVFVLAPAYESSRARVCARLRASVCVCVCVCVRARSHVCVLCVYFRWLLSRGGMTKEALI